MMRFTETEKLFNEEVREKKRTASNVHHKTGKRGYVGKMLFPTDFMSRKEKYNYRKSGKVVLSNLYEKIIPFDEFVNLNETDQRNMLIHWRNEYNTDVIKGSMGLSNSKYFKLVKDLDLPSVRGTSTNRNKRIAKVKAKPIVKVTEPWQAPLNVENTLQIPIPLEPSETSLHGLSVSFNGTYDAEWISKQLTKFQLLLDGETDDYYIELKIVQKTKE